MNKRKRKPTPPISKTARLKANLTRTLLQYIGGKRYEPMTLRELSKQLDIPAIHQTLFDELIDELSAEKKIGLSNERIVLAGVKERLVTGTIDRKSVV